MVRPIRPLILTALLGVGCVGSPLHARTFSGSVEGTELEIDEGKAFALRLHVSGPIPPVHTYEWALDASIDGDSVRLLDARLEYPRGNRAGAGLSYLYRFRAQSPGTSVITIEVAEHGEEARSEPFVLRVNVK